MKVKLLRTHRGWETGEEWHQAGSVIDVGTIEAEALIRCNWAMVVNEADPVDYADLSYLELRRLAKERGLSSGGKRDAIIRRLDAIDIVSA